MTQFREHEICQQDTKKGLKDSWSAACACQHRWPSYSVNGWEQHFPRHEISEYSGKEQELNIQISVGVWVTNRESLFFFLKWKRPAVPEQWHLDPKSRTTSVMQKVMGHPWKDGHQNLIKLNSNERGRERMPGWGITWLDMSQSEHLHAHSILSTWYEPSV